MMTMSLPKLIRLMMRTKTYRHAHIEDIIKIVTVFITKNAMLPITIITMIIITIVHKSQ